jgi:predicted unusual protein kinase regulating ubiquinone biosynthesis (AarF/ABC1/UbiB family)
MDLGVVDRIAPAMQAKLIQLLLSINEARADHAADLLVSMCGRRKNFDETEFRSAISELVLAHRDSEPEQTAIGQIFRGLLQTSSKCGATLPWELSELGAAMIKLDAVTNIIDANFNSRACVGRVVSQIMHKHIGAALSPAHIFHTVVETSQFLEALPAQVSSILDSIAHNNLKITVHAIDEHVLISGFQKIANRITVGLVLAALIIGAALLMRISTRFMIFGYPGLAMICFIAAAGFAFFLVISILVGDRKKTST